MNLFIFNLLLAVTWAALWGSFSFVQLTLGFAIGFANRTDVKIFSIERAAAFWWTQRVLLARVAYPATDPVLYL